MVNATDMFAQPELADEKNYYKGRADFQAQAQPVTRDWTAGLVVYDISKPAEPRRIGFMRSRGVGCIASGTSAGVGPTRRHCSTDLPITS